MLVYYMLNEEIKQNYAFQILFSQTQIQPSSIRKTTQSHKYLCFFFLIQRQLMV